MICVEGEFVCTKCGIVESLPDVSNISIYDSSPDPNLFLSQSIGTGEEIPRSSDTASIKKYFKGGLFQQKNLSCFSNACQKLNIPRHTRQDAWKKFQGMCKKMAGHTAEHACVSIFNACRRDGAPVTEDEIIEAVKISFGRKNLPSMAKIIYQHLSVLGHDESRENDDRYYFNIVLKERTKNLRISESRFARCERMAWFFFTEIYMFEGNYKRRARVSVDNAFGMTIRTKRSERR